MKTATTLCLFVLSAFFAIAEKKPVLAIVDNSGETNRHVVTTPGYKEGILCSTECPLSGEMNLHFG